MVSSTSLTTSAKGLAHLEGLCLFGLLLVACKDQSRQDTLHLTFQHPLPDPQSHKSETKYGRDSKLPCLAEKGTCQSQRCGQPLSSESLQYSRGFRLISITHFFAFPVPILLGSPMAKHVLRQCKASHKGSSPQSNGQTYDLRAPP